jgi:hypothetical protein
VLTENTQFVTITETTELAVPIAPPSPVDAELRENVQFTTSIEEEEIAPPDPALFPEKLHFTTFALSA